MWSSTATQAHSFRTRHNLGLSLLSQSSCRLYSASAAVPLSSRTYFSLSFSLGPSLFLSSHVSPLSKPCYEHNVPIFKSILLLIMYVFSVFSEFGLLGLKHPCPRGRHYQREREPTLNGNAGVACITLHITTGPVIILSLTLLSIFPFLSVSLLLSFLPPTFTSVLPPSLRSSSTLQACCMN